MSYLLWARGPSSEHAAVLRAGQIVRFGRSPANNLCFLLPSVSRFHLEATLDGAFVRVRNVNTVTGFRVNDLRYDDEATVRPGDRIRLAVVSLWLEEPPGIEPASLARDRRHGAEPRYGHPRPARLAGSPLVGRRDRRRRVW